MLNKQLAVWNAQFIVITQGIITIFSCFSFDPPTHWDRKYNKTQIISYRASGISPPAPVLAGPVFSQGKSKIRFLQKANNKQTASMILGLIRLIILSYNR